MPNGSPTLSDAGGNNITAAPGGPWPVVGAVPATATTVGTGVPLTIAETAGSCGSVGTTFTIALQAMSGGATACNIEIQDANAGATGGAAFPGGTTDVAALLPSAEFHIIVP